MVFPTFFNLNLNLAIRSSWSEPQSAPSLVFVDCIALLHLSVQFSRSVMSYSLWPHESQHSQASLSITNSRSLVKHMSIELWCHPAISSSVVPFSSCPQSLSASGSFPMSQLFAWGGQSIGVSASASVLPMSTQDWSALGWAGWISLQSKEEEKKIKKKMLNLKKNTV